MKHIEIMNTTPKTLFAALCIALLAPLGALADDAHHKPAATAGAGDMTDGEVRKVDIDAGKLTLKHADIKSLDMPAMTMVFVVQDKAMLGKLNTGDKIRFKVINDAGKVTITEIQPAP
jgi:Cu(I)/Ag(I) efflux system protein CusF